MREGALVCQDANGIIWLTAGSWLVPCGGATTGKPTNVFTQEARVKAEPVGRTKDYGSGQSQSVTSSG